MLFLVFTTFGSSQVFGQLSGYYQEDFEGSFPPEDWQVVNVLDPSYGWVHSPYTVHSGQYSVYVGSAIGQGEDWLILPQFSVIASDSFSFWLTAESLGFTDSTAVLVATTDDDPSSFTNLIATLSDGVNYPPVANLYQYYAYSLSAFAGQDVYVAIKNRNYEGDGVYIDLVSIGSPLGTGVTQITSDKLKLFAYPNPFTNSFSVSFSLDQMSMVQITVVDVAGREVAEVCNKTLSSGLHEVTWNGSGYPAGVYFCKVIANGNVVTYPLLKVD